MLQHQMATQSAIMRRASAELEKRRASLGATRGLRSDGTLDPHYAAILFRDSRGVSTHTTVHFQNKYSIVHVCLKFQLPVADPFLEKYNLSDSGKFPLKLLRRISNLDEPANTQIASIEFPS